MQVLDGLEVIPLAASGGIAWQEVAAMSGGRLKEGREAAKRYSIALAKHRGRPMTLEQKATLASIDEKIKQARQSDASLRVVGMVLQVCILP